jgi:hypothetical protein
VYPFSSYSVEERGDLMMKSLVLAFGFMLVGSSSASADSVLALRLSAKSNNRTTQVVEFRTCELNPNLFRSDCEQSVLVDGREVRVAPLTLRRLNGLRRSFSYDAATGGVVSTERRATCRMAGPARGLELETNYVTFDGNRIRSSELKTVLTQKMNCLYSKRVSLGRTSAAAAALEALTTLRTLAEQQR